MKRFWMLLAAVCTAGMLAGCGGDDFENKTPEQVRSEAAKMTAEDISAKIAECNKVIAAKTAELEKALAPLKDIKVTEVFSEKAKTIKEQVEKDSKPIKESLEKLGATLNAYQEALKEKTK